jgi:hypothetical protein
LVNDTLSWLVWQGEAPNEAAGGVELDADEPDDATDPLQPPATSPTTKANGTAKRHVDVPRGATRLDWARKPIAVPAWTGSYFSAFPPADLT